MSDWPRRLWLIVSHHKISLVEFLLERRPKSQLDLLEPSSAEHVESNQLKQKGQRDARAKNQEL